MDLAREPNFRLGAMDVRPSTREIVFAGGREVLEPRVMGVLVVLALAKGEVVTRDDLTAACWDGRAVSDDAINRVISRIRRTSELTQGRDFTLETITKVGYRLAVGAGVDAPAHVPAADAPSQPPVRDVKPRLLVPVALLAALAIAVATGAWWLSGRTPEWKADPNASLTVAVLPFDNLGSGADDNMLAVGMSREIRNTLSRVRGLKVVSDSSSFAATVQNLGAKDMREMLWADLLVDGSLSRTDEIVKLSAELVDAVTGNNLWTGSEEGPAGDLNRLQQLMSSAIFEQIVSRVGPNRLQQLAPPKPADPRVYRLLVEASELLSQSHDHSRHGEEAAALDAGDKSYAIARQALEADPKSAPALALTGWLIETGSTREFVGTPTAERFNLSADYMRRALAADPDNSVALQKLAEHYRRNEWRWADARALFERALALNPNDVLAHVFYSFYLSGTGRCIEALDHARIAEDLDPVGFKNDLTVPRMLNCVGRQMEADSLYLSVLDKDRSNLFILSEIYARFLARRDAEGLRALGVHVRDDLWKGSPSAAVQSILKRIDLSIDALGNRPQAFRIMLTQELDESRRTGVFTSPVAQGRRSADVSWLYAVELAFAGDTARAIDMLQKAITEGSLYIPETMPYGATEFTPEMRADPRYQAIWRSDPRLVELMRLRLEALEAGQMAGVFPDGRTFIPTQAVDTRS
jgi:TolB-like protein/DNA-binding winged helix-turn-helix (wHTH) protein